MGQAAKYVGNHTPSEVKVVNICNALDLKLNPANDLDVVDV